MVRRWTRNETKTYEVFLQVFLLAKILFFTNWLITSHHHQTRIHVNFRLGSSLIYILLFVLLEWCFAKRMGKKKEIRNHVFSVKKEYPLAFTQHIPRGIMRKISRKKIPRFFSTQKWTNPISFNASLEPWNEHIFKNTLNKQITKTNSFDLRPWCGAMRCFESIGILAVEKAGGYPGEYCSEP